MRAGVVAVRDVLSALDDHYPFSRRADWDNVGLLLGDAGATVRSVVVALDAGPAAVAACRRRKADLLLTHHPVIFTPRRTLSPGDPAYDLARLGTAVISAHTNADAAPRGVSWVLARRLGLGGIRPLVPGEPSDAVKLAVFVPPDRADGVMAAVAAAGGGRIGAYDGCSFRAAGTGTFRPAPWANPFAGARAREERVDEVRLETVVPAPLLGTVLRAVRRAHPYEEPAIDVFPLKGGGLGGGIGAVGDLGAPAPLERVLSEVFRRVRPAWIKVAGAARRPVRRIAVVAGSGAGYAEAARDAGADLLLTGDVTYHRALEAAWGGLPVADIGHGSGEKWIVPEFARILRERFRGLDVRIIMDREPLRPFRPPAPGGGTRP